MKTKLNNSIIMVTVCAAFLATSAQAQSQWAERIASTINTDDELSIGMTLDTNNNCFVTGWFDGTNNFGGVTLTNLNGGGQDIFVAKYNSTGALQWAHRAGGSTANRDAGRGIGVDTNGNIYVTGGFYGPADFGSFNLTAPQNQEELFLSKYNSAGTIQWVQQASGASGSWVYGTGLAVDSAGNCYAVGVDNDGATITFGTTILNNPSTTGYSTFLVKYDNTGALQWAQSLGGSGFVYATKVAVDANGNVYVRGCFTTSLIIGTSNLVASPSSTKNMFLAKFNNSGALTWVQQATGGNPDEGGVAFDQAQNVYVTGWFTNTLNFGSISLTNAGSYDAFLAKYNSSGVIQWAKSAGGGTTAGAYVGLYWDVAMDGQGNVYPTGALSPSGSAVAAVAKYNSAGTLQWTYLASSPPINPIASMVAKCAVDSAGNCFLAGWYQGTNTFGTNVLQPQGYWNYFLAKMAPPADLAPSSISGKSIIFNMTLPHVGTVNEFFSNTTYSNANSVEYGIYTWTKTDASNAVLAMTQQESGSDNGDVSTLDLNFTNIYSGTVTGQVAFAGGGSKPESGIFAFDTTIPALTITAPTSGQHMSNAMATVTGTAGDIWGVNAVWYQLTNGTLAGGTWSQAATTNSYTNWSATLTLAAGTNMVKAYAVNLGGIYSATNSVSFVSSNSFKLQLTFANTLPLTTNGLIFSLQLSTGLNGHIQVSTNLTSWATLTNFVGTNTTINFRDPAATNSSRRFYQAVIP